MRGQTISFVYVLNIVFQALFSLLFNIALMLGLGYLAVEVWGGPPWLYIPMILLGVLTGFVSMVRFILSAMRGLDRLEAERQRRKRGSNGK